MYVPNRFSISLAFKSFLQQFHDLAFPQTGEGAEEGTEGFSLLADNCIVPSLYF